MGGPDYVAELTAAITAVCPIEGVSIPTRSDRTTWMYWPSAGATAEQIAAADEVLATWVPADPPSGLNADSWDFHIST